MKIEDLEKALQYFVIAVPESEEQAKAYFWARKALTALRSMQEVGEPLTVEKLREVPHGKIKDGTLQNISNRANEIASPPAHIDRSEWTAEWKGNYRSGVSAGTGFVCSFCDMWNDRKSDFCPHCGKAMTEEAWEKLERRLQRMPLPEPPEEG